MVDRDSQTITVPHPDPTVLTTAQLTREIANAREIIESKIVGVKEILETRLAGMDKAITLLQEFTNKIPESMDEKIDQLRDLHQEKFNSISTQFGERDTRTEQTAAGVKIAVDAALQAAKEAVAEQNRSFALATGKSETATMKQIDALGLAIQTANKGLDDKIADMKDRLTRIEGMDLGNAESRSQHFAERASVHGGNQNTIAIVAVVAGLLIAVAGFVFGTARTQPEIVYKQGLAPIPQSQKGRRYERRPLLLIVRGDGHLAAAEAHGAMPVLQHTRDAAS